MEGKSVGTRMFKRITMPNSCRIITAVLLLVVSMAGRVHSATMDGNVGQITGTVLDEKTGEVVIGASVLIEGTTIGAACDMDGHYAIRKAPVGTCTLVVSSLGRVTKRITDVVVRAGQPVTVDAALAASLIEMKPIEVTVERAKGTESSLLIKRRTAVSVVDGVSAEMIRKSGDASAGDALRRVTGVSVVDGRSLVVRGMGGRYSNVRLNGATLPSPEPERREVPLDLFPSGLLQDIETAKTYTPDQPGSFSGGAVDMVTTEFPSKLTLNVTSTAAYSTTTTGKNGLSSGYSQKKFLGFDMGVDNGSRDLPSELRQSDWGRNDSTRRAAGNALASRRWTPVRSAAPANGGYSVNLGNRWSLGDNRELGVIASWTYSNSYRNTREIYRQWNGMEPVTDYTVERGVQTVLWGGMVSTALKLSENHKVAFAGILNRSGEDEARQAVGYDANLDQRVLETRLRFLSRLIGSAQLSGEHSLPWLLGSKIQWRTSLAKATRNEPGNRSNLYTGLYIDPKTSDTSLSWFSTGYSGVNIFSDLNDHDAQFALNWTLPLSHTGARLKFGVFQESKTRAFAAHRYQLSNYSGRPPSQGWAENIFIASNIGDGRNQYRLSDVTFADDHYDANEHNTGLYAMADFTLISHLRFIGGVRHEENLLRLNAGSRDVTNPTLHIRSAPRDWLPMASVIWSVTGRSNLRAVVSRTVARPEYRELSPFEFQDYALGPLTVGNSKLKTAYITNFDLRWELYPQAGQLVAVSIFWKKFKDPIERIVVPSGVSRDEFTYENSKSATDRGLELEARKTLDFLSPAFSGLTLGGNLTLVHSQIQIVGSGKTYEIRRPLQGQSPYMINVFLGYTSSNPHTEVSLVYSAFGDRLVSISRWPTEPYYEKTRHQLDLNLSQKLWQGLSLKASAKNLLGARYRVTQKQLIGDMEGKEGLVEDYKLGQVIGIGLTYSL